MIIRLLKFFLILSISFVLGALWVEKQIFPYGYLKLFYKNLLNEQSIQSTVDKSKIDTNHLPLLANEIDLSNIINGMSKGGICSSKDKVFGSSWKGEFFLFDLYDNKARKLNFSTPVTKSLKNAITIDPVRVHDIECNNEEKLNNITIFMSYDHIRNGMRSLRVSKFNVRQINTNYEFSDWKVLYTSKAWKDDGIGNSAGRLKLLKSGDLLLSVAYPSETHIGVSDGYTVKIDINTELSSIYTFGHRNIQGISEAKDGVIYAAEHGPKGGDELNVLNANNYYGWPLYTHGSNDNQYSWEFSNEELFGRHDFTSANGPIFSWVPSIAISNLIHLENFHKYWDGDIILGSLKSRSLYRIRIANHKVIFVERIWIGERIRDITEASGKIILFTDSLKMIILSIDGEKLDTNMRQSIDTRAKVMQKCTVCHHFGATTETHSAPSLTKIIGRKIASDSYSKYSNGLKSKSDNIWNTDNLKEFLRDPHKFSPGTYMPDVDINEYEIENIIKILLKNSES